MAEMIERALLVQEGEEKVIARENFSKWNEALTTGDAKTVAELYAEDAIFLPTLSKEFVKEKSGLEGYFQHFLEGNPNGEIIEDEVQVIGDQCYVHSGMYNFEIGAEDHRQTVEARFSFVWMQNNLGEWKIIHHHSSLKPKG